MKNNAAPKKFTSTFNYILFILVLMPIVLLLVLLVNNISFFQNPRLDGQLVNMLNTDFFEFIVFSFFFILILIFLVLNRYFFKLKIKTFEILYLFAFISLFFTKPIIYGIILCSHIATLSDLPNSPFELNYQEYRGLQNYLRWYILALQMILCFYFLMMAFRFKKKEKLAQ